MRNSSIRNQDFYSKVKTLISDFQKRAMEVLAFIRYVPIYT